VSSTGSQSNAAAENPWLSTDGSVIVFASNGSNLVNNDTNGKKDIFVRFPVS
jgi:hypothetical protein